MENDGEVDDFKRSFKALRWLLSAREDLEDLEDRRDATEPKSSTSTLGRKISASLELRGENGGNTEEDKRFRL